MPRFGRAAVEPGLAALARATTAAGKEWIAQLLGGLGVKDDRIRDALLSMLDELSCGTAEALGMYGDITVVDRLAERLDRFEVPDGRLAEDTYYTVVLLTNALVKLGAALTESQQEKLTKVFALEERELAARRLFR